MLWLAISYWRDGVIEATRLAEFLNERAADYDVRVICDLGHPACRHEPIQTLLDLGVDVRRLDRLHAKVWISEAAVLIGSANMSRSALQLNDHGDSNEETGVLSMSVPLVNQTLMWFKKLWDDRCTQIEQRDLDEKIDQHAKLSTHRRVSFSRATESGYKSFESMIGEAAGSEYRRSLVRLGFQYSGREGTKNMKMRYSEIVDTEKFVSGFVRALKRLINDSENKRAEFTGQQQERVPKRLYEEIKNPDGTPYKELLAAVKDVVENHSDDNLRLRESWNTRLDGKFACSIRLANELSQTDSGSVTLANIQPTYIFAGRDVPKKPWIRNSTR